MDRSWMLAFLFLMLALLAAGLIYAMLIAVKPRPVFASSLLYFAAGVLAFLGFIFLTAMLLYVFGPDDSATTRPGKVVFDACVTVIPPLATLILGFYFGKTAPVAPEPVKTDAPGITTGMNA